MSKNSHKQIYDQLTQWLMTLKIKRKKQNKGYGKATR